ncbi:MAG TPA: hypothetical protein VI790_02060 [Candidatus Nanoarchaeia archaeon]|nr:hypothetical protein [Candidatus Nanoarchaeia archaeon]
MAKKEDGTAKILAAVSYLWIIGLILLFVEKKNKFVIFHAKQATGIFAVSLLVIIIGFIPVINLIAWVLNILVFIAFIYGFVMALMGDEKEIPVVYDFGEKIAKMLNIE